MSKVVEGKGKTIDDAINDGLMQLGVTADEVETKVIQVPESGVFGLFGKKEAIVEVTLLDDPVNRAEVFLNNVISAMGVDCKIETDLDRENRVLKIELKGNDVGHLIGRRGQTLDSLQYLVSLVVNKSGDQYVRVLVDTENYRSKRQKTLENLADKMASKAIRYRKKVVLEPMNPSERRIIHAWLQKNIKVDTFSEGEEPYRKVVIQYKER